jgi:hypothetical protein
LSQVILRGQEFETLTETADASSITGRHVDGTLSG